MTAFNGFTHFSLIMNSAHLWATKITLKGNIHLKQFERNWTIFQLLCLRRTRKYLTWRPKSPKFWPSCQAASGLGPLPWTAPSEAAAPPAESSSPALSPSTTFRPPLTCLSPEKFLASVCLTSRTSWWPPASIALRPNSPAHPLTPRLTETWTETTKTAEILPPKIEKNERSSDTADVIIIKITLINPTSPYWVPTVGLSS